MRTIIFVNLAAKVGKAGPIRQSNHLHPMRRFDLVEEAAALVNIGIASLPLRDHEYFFGHWSRLSRESRRLS